MMSYFMEEVYRGSNPGYGSGDLIIATYGARGDRYAYGTYHEVMEDPENLPTGHRGFKEEVMASMRAELESAEAVSYTHLDVYKRQLQKLSGAFSCRILSNFGFAPKCRSPPFVYPPTQTNIRKENRLMAEKDWAASLKNEDRIIANSDRRFRYH